MPQFSIPKKRCHNFEATNSDPARTTFLIFTKGYGGKKIFIPKSQMTKSIKEWRRAIHANHSVDYLRINVTDWLYNKIREDLKGFLKDEIINA